jgi:hypothetical protein
MIIAPIPIRSLLIDTIGELSIPNLTAARNSGAEGVIAYLGGNLTAQAVANCFGMNLGLVPVNYSRADGWIPTADLGTEDARKSVASLSALGLPMLGLDDWCDVEGCGADPTAYCEAWWNIVAHDGAGRNGKMYVGAGTLLGGPQLYDLPFTGYWRSGSQVSEPGCGVQMVQLFPFDRQLSSGIQVDWNVTQWDKKNRAPNWIKG